MLGWFRISPVKISFPIIPDQGYSGTGHLRRERQVQGVETP